MQLYIEKEGIMLAFSPSGVRAPQRPQQAGNGRPAAAGEPFWEEAVAFTRHNFLQREVEVEASRLAHVSPSLMILKLQRADESFCLVIPSCLMVSRLVNLQGWQLSVRGLPLLLPGS